jgi:glutamate-ammonia-ligase adenylyltransferase
MLGAVRRAAPAEGGRAPRENFVDSVQRMRERVTEFIPAADVPYQLKLGPGGIRDIEFTVQLLQLVHGLTDDRIRQRGTLDALEALVAEGTSAADAAAFARDYRMLRVLEHRVQLRICVAPTSCRSTPDGHALARASHLASDGAGVWALWEGSSARSARSTCACSTGRCCRRWRPPADEQQLSTAQAHDRLAAIGFRDPAGALRHIGALTGGLSRKATIQRHLMPIMIRWFADGVDPDYGLLAFRRISERLGDTPGSCGCCATRRARPSGSPTCCRGRATSAS